MGKLTTHVLNLSAGIPAALMRLELHECGGSAPRLIVQHRTNDDGRCSHPLLEGTSFRPGRYALTFHVAEYFRAQGAQLPDPPFIDDVVIQFGIADPQQNYHVPLLVSPWSYSTYRGS
jgi:5-hydroxyisourate hydrolase